VYTKEHTYGSGDPSKARYMRSTDNDTIVEGKQLACEILITISQLETDAKCTVIMGKLKCQVIAAEKGHRTKQREGRQI